MKIIKIISEHKNPPKRAVGKITPVKHGYKRVMAIVTLGFGPVTRHIDVPRT